MYNLILGGAIAAALIPVLSGYLKKERETEGWKAVSTFINIAIVLMIVFSTLGIVFAPQLIPLVASTYGRETPVRLDLAVRITRIMFPSVSFLMLAGMCIGVLNSYQRFAVAAYGPAVYNVLTALSIFFLSSNNPEDNYGIVTVALGVMTSAILYFLFQFVFTLRHAKNNFKIGIDLKQEGFRKLFRLALPALIASSVMQINIIILVGFASRFEAGSVTALKMADRTWQMPLGIIAQSLGVAALPTLSRLFAGSEMKKFKVTFNRSFNTILMLVVPSAAGFFILREPIIRTLFKFGDRVSNEDVVLTAGILMFYSIAIIAQSIATFVNRSFYSINNTKTPLMTGVGTIIINIALCIIFYNYTSLGVAGMALSYSLATLTNGCLLVLLFNRRTESIKYGTFFVFIGKILLSSAVMGLLIFAFESVHSTINDGKVVQALYLGVEILAGAVVYVAAVVLLRVGEAQYLWDMLKSKLKKFIPVKIL
jgi:putative peptidoglycan lipid II flippase